MKILTLFLFSILIVSCSTLPDFQRYDGTSKKNTNPVNPHIDKKINIVHSLKAELPNGDTVSLIGIIKTNPDKKKMHLILMSSEGLTLLEALNLNRDVITVKKATPPFNSKAFVDQMFKDIKLIIYKPDFRKVQSGVIDNKPARRYLLTDGSVLDIIQTSSNYLRVNKYSESNKIENTIVYSDFNDSRIAKSITFTNNSIVSYKIQLDLISWEYE